MLLCATRLQQRRYWQKCQHETSTIDVLFTHNIYLNIFFTTVIHVFHCILRTVEGGVPRKSYLNYVGNVLQDLQKS